MDPQLALFSDEAWFHLQGYINTQNNRYWSSENPHLTHEVPLHPLKFGVCCAVSARRVAVHVSKKTMRKICTGHSREILSRVNRRGKTLAGISKAQLLSTLYVCLCRLCLISSGTEISAVVFGQHVRPILILVIVFFLGLFERQRLQQ
jgi:hypothetical protein